jgi:hypothetical protein
MEGILLYALSLIEWLHRHLETCASPYAPLEQRCAHTLHEARMRGGERAPQLLHGKWLPLARGLGGAQPRQVLGKGQAGGQRPLRQRVAEVALRRRRASPMIRRATA